MSEINIGAESAFPVLEREWEESSDIYKYSMTAGLTKREYFAGLALIGLLSSPDAILSAGNVDGGVAAVARGYADNLIKELEASNG